MVAGGFFFFFLPVGLYVHRYTGIHVCVCVCVCAHTRVSRYVCVCV